MWMIQERRLCTWSSVTTHAKIASTNASRESISVLRFLVSIGFWLFWLPSKVCDLLCNHLSCNVDPKFITQCNPVSNVLRYKVSTKSCCTSIQTKGMNMFLISRGMFVSANWVSTWSGYRKVNYYLLAENTPLSHSLLIKKWNNIIHLPPFTISGWSWLCGTNRLLSTVWTKMRWSDWCIWGSGMSWSVMGSVCFCEIEVSQKHP